MNLRNKRGDGDVQSFSIGWIIAIAFLIIVLIWYLSTYAFAKNVSQVIPKDTSRDALACSSYIMAGSNGENDYCYAFRKLDNDEYTNCLYLIEKYKVTVSGSGSLPFTCRDDGIEANIKIKCGSLKGKEIINGYSCTDWISGKATIAKDSTSTTTSTKTKEELKSECIYTFSEVQCDSDMYTSVWDKVASDGKTYSCCNLNS